MSVFTFPVYKTWFHNVFTEEKNTHNTNKPLLAQFRLTIFGSLLPVTIFPGLIEGFAIPVKGFLWSICSYNQSLVPIPSCVTW